MQNGPITTHVLAGAVQFDWEQGVLVVVRVRPDLAPLLRPRVQERIVAARRVWRRPLAKAGAKGKGKGGVDIVDTSDDDELDNVIDISSDDDV